MKYLKDLICDLGVVQSSTVLDVSQFLNKKVDPKLMDALGKDFYEHYIDYDFDLFVTVETSGIAPSIFASLYADKPLVIIKKERERKDSEIYVQQESYSFTKDHGYLLTSKKEFLDGKKVILLDDFLAKGSVVTNVDELLKQANASLVSTGICISKNFQEGYTKLRDEGYDLYIQAEIKELDTKSNSVIFND